MRRADVRVCFILNRTLRNILVHPKDIVPPVNKIGVIYRIQCKSCEMAYIGQTGRTLKHRINKYEMCLHTYVTSALAEHAQKENHAKGWDGYEVLDKYGRFKERPFLESWYIKKARKEVGPPNSYCSLLASRNNHFK